MCKMKQILKTFSSQLDEHILLLHYESICFVVQAPGLLFLGIARRLS
jgi:hypothetical protein